MTASAVQPYQPMPLVQPSDFSADQIDLIKQTVAAGTSDLELALFLEVAKSTGLNPFQRQIYAIKRRSGREDKMTIQTGIDGYRLIASRSGTHLGTTDPEFGPTKDGYPEWARVVVRRLVQGHVAEFPATARWSEYVQTKDEWANGQRTGKKTVSDMWAKMPHTMLGKCAEALALRKAFPAELSGVYTAEEMAQADNPTAAPAPTTRRADITREVAEAAGVQTQQLPDPQQEAALQAWASKIGEMAARVRKVAPADEVQATLDTYAWRSDLTAARACYDDLKALGLKHAQPPQAATPVQEAELLLSDGQRKALCAHGNRAGATTSEDRAALWAHALNLPEPIATKTLTEEQAHGALSVLSRLDDADLAQFLAEARAAFAPPIDAEPLPF